MKKPVYASLLILIVAAPPLLARDKTATAKPDATTTEAVFAPDVIKGEIGYLASDELRGRGSGEPGNDKAAQFVAQEFARNGLKPLGTNKQRDPKAAMDGSGYFQPFSFVAGRVVGSNNRLVVRSTTKGMRPLSPFKANQDYEPSSVSASGSVEGKIVFVGYGIHAPKVKHDDYASISVKDSIVLLLAGSPKDDPHSPLADYADIYPKAIAARDLGAKAVLVIMPDAPRSQPPSRTGFDNVSDAGIPVLRLRHNAADALMDNSGRGLDALQQAANGGERVSEALDQIAQVQVDVKKVEKITANVIGMIEGSDPVLKNEYVVIGAHVDHLGMGGAGSLAKSSAPAIHHGADDNASGAAGVMELAKYFSQGKERVEDRKQKTRAARLSTINYQLSTRPKRSIILMCFSGEELGLFGSDWYAKHPIVPLNKTVAMLNMDMIGRLRDNKLTVIGSGTAKEWDSLLDDVNKSAGFALGKSESGFGASDQQSFYTKNVPVLFFFTGTHSQYHTPEDTVDLINSEGEAKVLKLVADCATRIADNPTRPTFQRINLPTAPSSGLRVYFGSVPDYAANVVGVQLNGVREGSPAEKSGLKAGDIIVKFNGRVIKNVYDYTYALQDCKPNDMVQIEVKRGDAMLKLNVILAARPE